MDPIHTASQAVLARNQAAVMGAYMFIEQMIGADCAVAAAFQRCSQGITSLLLLLAVLVTCVIRVKVAGICTTMPAAF